MSFPPATPPRLSQTPPTSPAATPSSTSTTSSGRNTLVSSSGSPFTVVAAVTGSLGKTKRKLDVESTSMARMTVRIENGMMTYLDPSDAFVAPPNRFKRVRVQHIALERDVVTSMLEDVTRRMTSLRVETTDAESDDVHLIALKSLERRREAMFKAIADPSATVREDEMKHLLASLENLELEVDRARDNERARR